MKKAVEQNISESNQTVPKTQPVVKWVHEISDWAMTFFTLTEQEKDAAGIRDYKSGHL